MCLLAVSEVRWGKCASICVTDVKQWTWGGDTVRLVYWKLFGVQYVDMHNVLIVIIVYKVQSVRRSCDTKQ